MKLSLSSIVDRGVLKDERVVLRVNESVDVGSMLMLQVATASDGRPSTGIFHTYWFPDHQVKSGDLVVLYTKEGQQSSKPIKASNRNAHFFYWGISSPIWNVSDRMAVLLSAPEWEAKTPAELKPKS